MTDLGEINSGKQCRIGPLVLGGMQLFSAATGMTTEVSSASHAITSRDAIFLCVWFGLWLSPVVLLVIVRNSCVLLQAHAFPIVPIFIGRVYYTSLFLKGGHLPQMGDWAIWLNDFFGLIVGTIGGTWMLFRLLLALVDLMKRTVEHSRGGLE